MEQKKDIKKQVKNGKFDKENERKKDRNWMGNEERKRQIDKYCYGHYKILWHQRKKELGTQF